jgi:hypothetical protein
MLLKLYSNLFWRFLFPCLVLEIFNFFCNHVTSFTQLHIWGISNCCVFLLFLSNSFERCGTFVNLTYIIKHTVFLNKSIKNSKDTQQLLMSHYICNWVNDVTRLQTKWNISRTKHGNKNLQNKLLYSFKSMFV